MDAKDQTVRSSSLEIPNLLLTGIRCSIILDEIHTIGQQEGGAVWEQIILLAPCPLV